MKTMPKDGRRDLIQKGMEKSVHFKIVIAKRWGKGGGVQFSYVTIFFGGGGSFDTPHFSDPPPLRDVINDRSLEQRSCASCKGATSLLKVYSRLQTLEQKRDCSQSIKEVDITSGTVIFRLPSPYTLSKPGGNTSCNALQEEATARKGYPFSGFRYRKGQGFKRTKEN